METNGTPKKLYRWCNEHNVYVNAPDWYFLDGTNKIAFGYREVNFSLPRDQQLILNRQNIFDGTWEKKCYDELGLCSVN